MDKQQQQKILLAVVAVVALGAGSWFVFLRKPAEVNRQAFQEGPAVRRQRETADEDKPTRRARNKGTRTRKTAAPVVRRERAEREDRTAERKQRRGKKTKREKKKEIKPAA